MQAIRRWPRPIRCSTARRAPADVVDVDARRRRVRAGSPGGRSGSRHGRGGRARRRRRAARRRPGRRRAGPGAAPSYVPPSGSSGSTITRKPADPGGRGEAAERLGQGGVAGDLLGRLAQDEARGCGSCRRRARGPGRGGGSRARPRPAGPARRVGGLMFAPGRSLRTNDTVVRDTPARAATSALVGRRREMAIRTPGSWAIDSEPLLRALTERPGSWTLTRVSNAYYTLFRDRRQAS